jgi:transcriptional regulator with XRE-family HTH domain
MQFARQIGQRVRARRLDVPMTQKQLADELGVTYQQVQRYESGADQMSTSRLNQIALVLEMSPGSFFPPPNDGAGAGTNINGVVTVFDDLSSLVNRPDTIQLLRAFANVRGKTRRAYVIEFVEIYASRHATSWPSRYKQVSLVITASRQKD